MNKREFLRLTGAAGVLAASGTGLAAPSAALTSLTTQAAPISPAERRRRIAEVQRRLAAAKLDALLLEAGSSLVYFTGVNWWRSERFTGAIIPARGDIAVVTPHFEEPSVRESLAVDAEVRTWNEDENPYAELVDALAKRGIRSGKIAVEETVRFFVVDGMLDAGPKFTAVAGADVVRGCRMLKSPDEIALLKLANEVTMAAYRHVHAQIEAGMAAGDIAALMNEATRALGGTPEFSMVLLNEASAYPHGTDTPQAVREGSIILMDCGCSVHGYQSDISRTWVYGEPTARQRELWNTVRRGQEIALEQAQPGTAAGKVDDAVREYYERLGWGPGYKTPGLPHRTGHGIGMDVHEPVNFVHGEATPLAPGMCFSNEPGLYVFGEFGVRLEDCLHITADGPVLFSALSPSIDEPFG